MCGSMVDIQSLTAEIRRGKKELEMWANAQRDGRPVQRRNVWLTGSLVWGTPGNFNGFRVLAALLHGTLVVGVSQTAALNRGSHLHSAGRPSRWALAHILVFDMIPSDHLMQR